MCSTKNEQNINWCFTEQEICNYGEMPNNSCTQKNVQLKNHEISLSAYLNGKIRKSDSIVSW